MSIIILLIFLSPLLLVLWGIIEFFIGVGIALFSDDSKPNQKISKDKKGKKGKKRSAWETESDTDTNSTVTIGLIALILVGAFKAGRKIGKGLV